MQNQFINFAKYRAPRVHHIVQERLLAGNLIEKPLWFDVVSMYPPQPRPSTVVHRDKTRFSAILAQESVQDHHLFAKNGLSKKREQEVSAYVSALPYRKWKITKKWGTPNAWRKAVVEAGRVVGFPEEIVYPEDRLRQKFYSDHPLEQMRPRVLKEREASDQSAADVEDVVQLTRSLMTEQGMSEPEAYKIACEQFYAARRKEQDLFQREVEQRAEARRQELEQQALAERQAILEANEELSAADSLATEDSKDGLETAADGEPRKQQAVPVDDAQTAWLKYEEKVVLDMAREREEQMTNKN